MSFYPILLGIMTICTIQFGLLRTKEEKENIPMYDKDEDEADTL